MKTKPINYTPASEKYKKYAVAVVVVVAILIVTSFYVLNNNSKADSLLGQDVPQNLKNAVTSKEVKLANGETYDLTASFVKSKISGQSQTMLAYNGSIPGPTIKVAQGDKVNIVFKNDINMESTVHAHGLRQDVKMEGTPDLSQEVVRVGDTFNYTWSFPDPGIYWYHPHVREDYQQGAGLYGAIIVEPKDSTYLPKVDGESTLVLSDALVDSKTNILEPFAKSGTDRELMGRYGNISLVNGQTDWSTQVPLGSVQRFYIANTSSARPYRFALENTKLKIVGSDNGRVGVETLVDAVTLGPGERYIVDAFFEKHGEINILNDAPGIKSTIGKVKVVEDKNFSTTQPAFANLRTNSDVVAEIASLASKVSQTKNLSLIMSMGNGSMNMDGDSMGSMNHIMPDGSMMDSQGNTIDPELAGIEWSDSSMNMNANNVKWRLKDINTGKINSNINWSFKKGEVIKINIDNDANSMHPMQHPIHLHGQRFAVSKIDGQDNENIEWKDTVLVPSGKKYEILVVMDNPGEWMLHCHISEHLENGMSMKFKVI